MPKIVVKVCIHCEKCKQDVFKAVTKLTGINQLSLDGEKGLLTVIGTVDSVEVVERIRDKTKKRADLVTVGPVEAPKPPEPAKPDPVPDCFQERCRHDCEFVGLAYGPPPVHGGWGDCTIL
uniref:HMA domain-containing protein n=1 Tax=Kalanchoe fedtschenkoi TaxID=63787 RepID=A0A7N1A072_KALFE